MADASKKKGTPLEDDPVFQTINTRPAPEQIVTRIAGSANTGRRSNRPLTDAVLATATSGGSVVVPYTKKSHDRLLTRFKGIESRTAKTDKPLVFGFSYMHINADTHQPGKVQWWCRQVKVEPGAESPGASAPPPASRESVVGRDVE